ncbi:hypothetical protein [Nocardioides speluncae]|uniref:hypothetical protein n=1 Tax=Nocardioides speluncae TaxID=2670337 RepID=UPI000D694D30|nr:hypothetical protein [Nocardioides speluncae]
MTNEVKLLLRRELLLLAGREDIAAAQEAALVPYWAPCPASVVGHRAAARALREAAEQFLAPTW